MLKAALFSQRRERCLPSCSLADADAVTKAHRLAQRFVHRFAEPELDNSVAATRQVLDKGVEHHCFVLLELGLAEQAAVPHLH